MKKKWNERMRRFFLKCFFSLHTWDKILSIFEISFSLCFSPKWMLQNSTYQRIIHKIFTISTGFWHRLYTTLQNQPCLAAFKMKRRSKWKRQIFIIPCFLLLYLNFLSPVFCSSIMWASSEGKITSSGKYFFVSYFLIVIDVFVTR